MKILKKILVESFFLLESILISLLQYMRKFLQWYQEEGESKLDKSLIASNDLDDFAIVVTTFEARFFKYALPLIREIREHTDIPIFITINGNYEKTQKNINLKKFINEISQFVNVYPIAFANLRGCAALWNSGIDIADSKNYLILNDDIHVNGSRLINAMKDIESALKNDGLVTINDSFSHFAVSEKCLEEVGLFDEHFLGFGHEDGDYMHRYLVRYGKKHLDIKLSSFLNLSDDSKDQSVSNSISKYSIFNLRMVQEMYKSDEVSGIVSTFDKPMTRVTSFVNPRPLFLFRKRHYKDLVE